MSTQRTVPLAPPGRGRGLRDVLQNRYLLKLLVDKEIQVRYRGSVLGILWSYIKPGVQFGVFYVAMGLFLGLERGMQNYAIYLFSGMIVINFFSEGFSNGAKAMVVNGALIKKIYLPRELFSVSTIWVALIHFVPQILVLLVACFFAGWSPDLKQLGAALVGMVIIMVFSAGLGLVFGVANVFFRDSENIVDMLLMVATWFSPVLYSWTMVRDTLYQWVLTVYLINPLTVAVELFHYAFWIPTLSEEALLLPTSQIPPHLLTLWVPVALGISLFTLFLGDLLFRKLEGNFAQEL
ncbi:MULTISPECIES: ABC transporter permease [Rothia]|uniref:Transport permease protein n=1 Tax=Rothia nasimurium TaxID=85336 RepID=A0A1Y1RPP3_9MICC|nr:MULTISPECIES: ABC transporter permease [Rothia]ORC18851.1 sugar ABC transporter permease [Rothia nasimurium]